MDLKEFSNKIIEKMEYLNININEYQILQLYNYMNLLIEWNKKINLTAIIDPDDIIIKHFIDSITITKFIATNSKIIDDRYIDDHSDHSVIEKFVETKGDIVARGGISF